jgi:hypothetical protein
MTGGGRGSAGVNPNGINASSGEGSRGSGGGGGRVNCWANTPGAPGAGNGGSGKVVIRWT